MAEPFDPIAEGLDAEYLAIQEARRRIEASGADPATRSALLEDVARREALHAGRVAEYDAGRPPPGQEPGLVAAREVAAQETSATTLSSSVQTTPPTAPSREPAAPRTPVGETVSFDATPLRGNSPEEDQRDLLVRRRELEQVQEAISRIDSGAMSIGSAIAGTGDVRESTLRRLRARASELEQEVRLREEDYSRRAMGSVEPVKAEPVGVGFTTSTPYGVTPVPVGPPGAGTPESIARDFVTAPGGATGGEGTPTGTPTRPGASGGRGGAAGGSRTADLAAQLQAALQGGGEGADEILARLVESYRQEGFQREEFGQSAADLVTAEAEQQRRLADTARAAFMADLADQERRLAEVDAQIGALTSTPFNANRLFHDQGLNVSMALGVAVNAATAVMQNALFPGSNATNTALALVQGAIERDVQTQMVNFERGVQRLTSTRTAYDMARQLSGDRQAAYEFAMSQSQRHAGEQLRAMAMQVQGVTARENLMRQADNLLLQAAQRDELARMQMAQALYERAGRGGGGPARRGGGEAGQAWASFAVRTDRAEGMTDADIERTLGQSTASNLRAGLDGIAESVDILDEISSLVGGYSSMSLVDRARMGSLIANFQDAYRKASGMGALDAGALDVLKRVLANPNDVTTTIPEFQAQLRTQRSRLIRSARRRVNTMGGGVVRFDPRSDPSGANPGSSGLGEGVTPVNETRPQTPTLGATLADSTPQEAAEAVLDVTPESVLSMVAPGVTRVRQVTQQRTGGN